MKNLLKSLSEAKKEIGKISKETTNPFYKSKYFDINALLEHVEPILEKHGLMVLQPINNSKVCSIIYHVESGEEIESGVELPQLNDPQKLGSAITYYRRYTLQSLLSLQAEDDDANKTVKNPPRQKQKPELVKGSVQWKSAIDYLKGNGNILEIQKKYNISNENIELLKSESI